ncbi:HU family DNA-binding protein [Caenimonas aquaedulcis]|uniref:HU family DNA-binding protein n=1 Tax=Caenimonas aquaedulcis TaxID=2793270 RepID=A0A931H465_9BURK|nr:HU family DNA-binding protein [Caenimonas aquaedulcis]MBG9388182.1 HU family DNA-binding protein [Caenimonas aquaedulcis]
MTINELVDQVKAAGGKQFEAVPDPKARALVRAVLAEIGKQIQAGGSEPVRIPGFGAFRTTEVEREKDGAKTLVKKIHFRPLPAKQ